MRSEERIYISINTLMQYIIYRLKQTMSSSKNGQKEIGKQVNDIVTNCTDRIIDITCYAEEKKESVIGGSFKKCLNPRKQKLLHIKRSAEM